MLDHFINLLAWEPSIAKGSHFRRLPALGLRLQFSLFFHIKVDPLNLESQTKHCLGSPEFLNRSRGSWVPQSVKGFMSYSIGQGVHELLNWSRDAWVPQSFKGFMSSSIVQGVHEFLNRSRCSWVPQSVKGFLSSSIGQGVHEFLNRSRGSWVPHA